MMTVKSLYEDNLIAYDDYVRHRLGIAGVNYGEGLSFDAHVAQEKERVVRAKSLLDTGMPVPVPGTENAVAQPPPPPPSSSGGAAESKSPAPQQAKKKPKTGNAESVSKSLRSQVK